jgi:hypothetical protein
MQVTVSGVFASVELSQLAVQKLLRAGFPPAEIQVVGKDTPHRHDVVNAETSDAARGAATGAAVGGVFAAVCAGALALPGVNVIAAAPVLAALAGGGAGAAAGGVVGLLIGSATGHQVAEEYEHALDEGRVLVAVHTDRAHALKAREALLGAGGKAISDSVHRNAHSATA